MPITIDWVNDAKSVIRMNMIGQWTWDEAYEGQKEGDRMINEESTAPFIGAVIDLTKSTGVPLAAMANGRSMGAKQHPKVKATVFVGAGALFMSLWNVFEKVYGMFVKTRNFAFCKTLEEAVTFLEKRLAEIQRENEAAAKEAQPPIAS